MAQIIFLSFDKFLRNFLRLGCFFLLMGALSACGSARQEQEISIPQAILTLTAASPGASATPSPQPSPTATATVPATPTATATALPIAWQAQVYSFASGSLQVRIPKGWQVEESAYALKLSHQSDWIQISLLNTGVRLKRELVLQCAGDWWAEDFPSARLENWHGGVGQRWQSFASLPEGQLETRLWQYQNILVRLDGFRATGGQGDVRAILSTPDFISPNLSAMQWLPVYSRTRTVVLEKDLFEMPLCWRQLPAEKGLVQFHSPDRQMVIIHYQTVPQESGLEQQVRLVGYTMNLLEQFLPAAPQVEDARKLMPDGSERMNFVLPEQEISGEVYYVMQGELYNLFGAFWQQADEAIYLPVFQRLVLSFRTLGE